MKTEIVSGFPGVGKTYYKKHAKGKVLDSDSSKFSWAKKGVRNPDFPQNYMAYIKEYISKVDVIMVSSHKVVRDALVEAGIKFTLAYPYRGLKAEYLFRYKNRGNDQAFIDMMNKNWNKFIDELEKQPGCKTIRLSHHVYLVDYFNESK